MSSKDPYEILGVSRSATPDEIKRAYRRLAKQHHPDRNPGDPTAEQRFKEVQAAYEVLGDPQRRAEYDRFGAGGPRPDVRAWSRVGGIGADGIRFDFGSLGDLTEIFEQFFSRAVDPRGRRAGRRAAASGPDVEGEIELSFDEALRGTVREIVLGDGARRERIKVRVPAGVTDGERIRVPGRGQAGPGGRGDLLIRCRVAPHPVLRREGADLVLDLPLTVREAVLGTRVEIPTPKGPTLLTVPPGTSSGTKLRLRGHGAPDRETGRTGDLYAVVRIVVPRAVSAAAQHLVEQFDAVAPLDPRSGAGWPK